MFDVRYRSSELQLLHAAQIKDPSCNVSRSPLPFPTIACGRIMPRDVDSQGRYIFGAASGSFSVMSQSRWFPPWKVVKLYSTCVWPHIHGDGTKCLPSSPFPIVCACSSDSRNSLLIHELSISRNGGRSAVPTHPQSIGGPGHHRPSDSRNSYFHPAFYLLSEFDFPQFNPT